jgi:RNA polymerase sigma factor (sigma-70 family)
VEDKITKMHLLRLQSDDMEAFNALYVKYHAAIYLNVLKITRNFAATEDIVQDVFITLWEKRNSLNPDQEISGWLFVVSHNKSVTYLKRKLQESLVLQKADIYHQPPEPAIDLKENDYLTNGRMNLLAKAIEQLSPQKRKVFELCKVQRRTYEEAACELKLSKHTVKEYLASAVLSIKEFIKKYPDYSLISLPLIAGHIFF